LDQWVGSSSHDWQLLVYTAGIMFVLRSFGDPRRLSPPPYWPIGRALGLGLLA
jgi:hypothetical protein